MVELSWLLWRPNCDHRLNKKASWNRSPRKIITVSLKNGWHACAASFLGGWWVRDTSLGMFRAVRARFRDSVPKGTVMSYGFKVFLVSLYATNIVQFPFLTLTMYTTTHNTYLNRNSAWTYCLFTYFFASTNNNLIFFRFNLNEFSVIHFWES